MAPLKFSSELEQFQGIAKVLLVHQKRGEARYPVGGYFEIVKETDVLGDNWRQENGIGTFQVCLNLSMPCSSASRTASI